MTFDAQSTTQDLHTLRDILAQFFSGVRDDDWGRKTGSREKDWTLAETTAHLVSIMITLNDTIEAARAGESVAIAGMTQREDLRDWNAAQIAGLLDKHTPPDLVVRLDTELARAEQLATLLTADEAATPVAFPFYNRPAPLGHLIVWQLSHAGVVHGAQLARALDQAPLWERHSAEMRQRQLGRFLLHFSWAYWNTLLSDVSAVLHIHVAGESGGDWTLVAAPDGGSVREGVPQNPTFTYHFANPDVFFALFTINETFQNAQAHGEFRVDGDPEKAIGLLRYFAASPPK